MRHRRNKQADLAGLAGSLSALAVLFLMISDQARMAFVTFGRIVAIASGILFFWLVAWMVYRRFAKPSKLKLSALDFDYSPPGSLPSKPAAPLLDQRSQVPVNRSTSTEELISQIRSIDWYQFEKLVELIYRKSGFNVSRRGGANPDGGIDMILRKEGEQTAVQCKHWKTWNVGVKAMREFLGALTDARISKGIFITLSGYSGDAKVFAEKHGIEIINETALVRLLKSARASDDPETKKLLTDKRKFCPKCESEMVMRVAKKGLNVGKNFWGCSQYPRCRYTVEHNPQSSASFASPLR